MSVTRALMNGPAPVGRGAASTGPLTPVTQARVGRREFVLILAMSMGTMALAIDIMLPAFPEIREALGLPEGSAKVGQVVTAFFIGVALGQIPMGLLCDRFGRKPVLRLGMLCYAGGALATMVAPNLAVMTAARFVWGIGASAPRVACLAVVRDRYSGSEMARVMSTIMAIFIVVPIIAPSIGAGLLAFGSWRVVFGFCAAAGLVIFVWTARLSETLRPEHRRPLRFGPVLAAGREVLRHRETVLFGLAMTALMGAFTGYITGAERIFDEGFEVKSWFPAIFGLCAAGMGVATFANSRIVHRIGLRRAITRAIGAMAVLAVALLIMAFVTDGTPPLGVFLPVWVLMLAAYGQSMPNLNSAAMEPVGAVAGTAAAILGAVSLAGGSLIGAAVDHAFDGTVRPLVIAFVVAGAIAILCLWLSPRSTAEHAAEDHRDLTRS